VFRGTVDEMSGDMSRGEGTKVTDLLELVRGDITRQCVDAIVNAANTGLVGGGGVDGAIHRAGGPAIMAACDRLRELAAGTPCPTGSAVETTAGRLAAKAVIHTAGPRWRDGEQGEPSALASCYRSCLEIAAAKGYRTVAFPSISTGIYGYPVARAAEVALATTAGVFREKPGAFDFIRFVLFSDADLRVYERVRAALRP
jgi:O-acetyl-ADP-ribose deacetylase (regulator of RNase III)